MGEFSRHEDPGDGVLIWKYLLLIQPSVSGLLFDFVVEMVTHETVNYKKIIYKKSAEFFIRQWRTELVTS